MPDSWLTKQLGFIVRGGALAYLVKETAQAYINMAILAGRIQGVEIAFKRLPQNTVILEEMRRATNGVLTDFELMQRILQAQNFGLPIEKLGILFEFASTRAQQTGISVDYLVDSIFTVLGRNSLKILDNLQINIGELKEPVS